ncbi:MAG: NTPase [Nitrospira sp.]|nr:MAG: NTPase [Nitrospira sp.]
MTALSADRPSIDPKEDLFGHAPFAASLANSIRNYQSSDGLVLALYGPWGSGKSTVLSYVRYYLELLEKNDRPVIISFNPWWFSGQDNLARAFLGQLQAVLPNTNEKFKRLSNLLGEFAEGVGGLIDLTGMTGGLGSKLGKLLGIIGRQKPKDVPALKAEISKILLDADKRILILIDDIDRLTPEETRQLFTVIKALGDFPNVVYLLAFDREVATYAIEQQVGLPGDRYLEKIIQVPFELPPIDQTALHAALFKRLDKILGETPEGLFDQSYWINVFHDGIDALIKLPRDVVRFTNTLSVTYQTIRGEVNPVDFIALEALRVFLPDLYAVIRTNQEMFAGQNHETPKTFHEKWASELPEELRVSIQAMMERLFPKIDGTSYGPDSLAQWRRNLQVCHPDLFPLYFRLTVPPGAVRRSDLRTLLSLADTPAALGQALIAATLEKRPDGLSKARALLERIMDHVESDIPVKHVPVFISVLLNIGDDLVLASDEQGFFDFGNESRVTRVVYHLLKRIEKLQRLPLLKASIAEGRGIGVQRYLLVKLLDYFNKEEAGETQALIEGSALDELKAAWLNNLRTRVGSGHLLTHKQLASLLTAWSVWAEPAEVRRWCEEVTTSDEGLLTFLTRFCSYTRLQTMGDSAVRLQPRLNPKWLEEYIDTSASALRLVSLQAAGKVSSFAQEAVVQFLIEYEMIKAGKNPDSSDALDD